MHQVENLRQAIVDNYWLEKLSETAEPTVLNGKEPALFAAAGVATAGVAPDRLAGLNALGKNQGISEFVVGLSVFGLLLGRYFNCSRLLVASADLRLPGYPSRPDHLLFYQLTVTPGLTLRELIKNTGQEVERALQHSAYSYEILREGFEEKGIGEENVLQFGFCHPGVNLESSLLDQTLFRLNFTRPEGGALAVDLHYDASVFDAWLAEQFAGHYCNLLQRANDLLDEPVEGIDILTAEDNRRLLAGFNAAPAPADPRKIADLFEAQVCLNPNAVALVSGGQKMTYGQLNRMSNRLAHHLAQEYGVGPDALVGIMADKLEWIVVSMLGILKAGGAFLPIDPKQPARRTQYILKDSALKLLMIQSDFLFNLEDYGGDMFAIDIQLDTLDGPETDPAHPGGPADLAYVIYTSGTTGQPKGVMVEQASVVNYFNWLSSTFSLGPADSSVLLSSFAFDLGYTSIWGTLLGGGTLHMLGGGTPSPEAILQYLCLHKISFLKTTPSLFYMLIRVKDFSTYNNLLELRLAFLGGEAIRAEDVGQVLGGRPQMTIVNHYGPTETTIGTIAYPVTAGQVEAYRKNPVIGRPITNSEVIILDPNGRMAPVGVVGEIAIGGPGLARGYLNGPEATAAKFVPHPYRPGARLYKTGDYGRWLPDGTVAFRGRKDNQVKIRGYRVELGEVEHALRAHPAVQQAVVLARADKDQVNYLVAFLIHRDRLPATDLRKYLGTQLPEYMVPSYFFSVDAFPLTANGKLDLKALAALEPAPTEADPHREQATNETERLLTEIWEEVLDRRPIGINDNFFDLGGHSLKATQVLSRAYEKLRTNVDLGVIFANPTIKQMAGVIQSAAVTDYQTIEPVAWQPYYDASHAQRRMWILNALHPGQIAYNKSTTFHFEGALDQPALNAALGTLLDRHESLRTTFVTVEGELKQRINELPAAGFPVRYNDLRNEARPRHAAQALATRDAGQPFDLENGPLVRAFLYQFEDQKYLFLLSVHHIISDGWSSRVLNKELMTLYNAYREGRENPLPPLGIQYKDYTAWFNEQLQGEKLKQHQAYWWRTFDGELPVLQLPTDYPRPALKTFNGNTLIFELDEALTDGIRKLSQANGASLFIVHVALVNVLLYRYSGQKDIILGTDAAGRTHKELENQIGFYLNTYALRNTIDSAESFAQFLGRVKAGTVSAYEHQAYPFQQLVEDLRLDRDAASSPLFDVFVLADNDEEEAGEGAGTGTGSPAPAGALGVSTFTLDLPLSKFDLTFSVKDRKQKLLCSIEFNSDLFKRSTITEIRDHLLLIMRAVVDNPGVRVGDIHLPLAESQEGFDDFTRSLQAD